MLAISSFVIIRLCSKYTASGAWFTVSEDYIYCTTLTIDWKMNSWPGNGISVAIIIVFVNNVWCKSVGKGRLTYFMLAGKLFICLVLLWFKVCTILSNLVKEKRQWKSWCYRQYIGRKVIVILSYNNYYNCFAQFYLLLWLNQLIVEIYFLSSNWPYIAFQFPVKGKANLLLICKNEPSWKIHIATG